MQFKFELDQVVFFIRENRVHSAPVLARMLCENLRPNYNSTPAQREVFTPFGVDGEYYGTCFGIMPASSLFATKEDLAANLVA